MSESQEIDYLIELVISGEADDQQFDQLIELASSDSQIAELLLQRTVESCKLDEQVRASDRRMSQQSSPDQGATSTKSQAEENRRRPGHDLDLEM